MTELVFPPLFDGRAVSGQTSAFDTACDEAVKGCDAGLVVYNIGEKRLDAAIVFAPEVALDDAMVMLPLCSVGFQNALGAIGPPKLAIHFDWTGIIRLNGGEAGLMKAKASTDDAEEMPDWLVIGLDLTLWPVDDEAGHTPDKTALYAEGGIEVDPAELVESWVRHTLVGITRWQEDGAAPLHKEWTGLAHGIGERIERAGQSGEYIGVDERFGLLMRDADTTHLVPLTELLEQR